MNISRTELQQLVRRGVEIRRRPTFAKADESPGRDPSMAPTRGLTPRIPGPGWRSYLHEDARGIALARWNDDRDRVPVISLRWDALEGSP